MKFNILKGLLSKDGPQANLFGGLTLVITASIVAVLHVFFPVIDIVLLVTALASAGTALLGFTWKKTQDNRPT